MAEDPTFSGMSSTGDAAEAFAKVTSQIKSDMAAMEKSAKAIEQHLGKAAKHSIGRGGVGSADKGSGGTGDAAPAFSGSSLGQITSQLGGSRGMASGAAFGAGALMGGLPGGIAFAGLPDLVMRPERALNMEAARFGMAQATGDFGTFQNMMDTARNGFNVQNERDFMNTMVYGTQRMGMVGLAGGEQRAASMIGGYNTLAGMAGIDQSAVPGIMNSMNSAQAFYSGMASNIQTRNPVTGELISPEGQINQIWDSLAGVKGMSQEDALKQIDINYGVGTTGRANLEQIYQGDQNAVQLAISGLRIRARQGGDPLKENQVQDQVKGKDGGLDSDYTEAMEKTRELESAKMNLGADMLDAATSGIATAAEHITSAVDLLADLPPELEKIRDAYVTLVNGLDVTKTELPRATSALTDFFSGLPNFILSALGVKSLLGPGGGGGAGLLGRLGLGRLAMGALANPVGMGVAAGAATIWAVNKYGDKEANAEMGTNPDKRPSYLSGKTAPSSSSAYSYTKGYSKGEWFVESDQIAQVHYGEMVVPNRIATAVREELAVGKTSPVAKREGTIVNINLTIQKASDQEAVYFAHKVKRLIEDDRELMSIGSGRLGYA